LNVRPATPSDIPAIMTLEGQADTAAHWSDEIYNSIFVPGAVQRIILVVDDRSRISAFVVARTVGDEWEIENIVVEANLRRLPQSG
jgi:hypothetical protein